MATSIDQSDPCPFFGGVTRQRCQGVDIDAEHGFLVELQQNVRKWEKLHRWDVWGQAKADADRQGERLAAMTRRTCCDKNPRYPKRTRETAFE